MKTISLFRVGMSVVIALIADGCGINTSPGTGTKIGQVVKVTKIGMLSKTWEAELIRGGMSGGSGSFGVTPFDFTIESEEQAKLIEGYMDKQTEIIITYRSEGIYSQFRTDSRGHFLVTVRPATNSVSFKSEKQ